MNILDNNDSGCILIPSYHYLRTNSDNLLHINQQLSDLLEPLQLSLTAQPSLSDLLTHLGLAKEHIAHIYSQDQRVIKSQQAITERIESLSTPSQTRYFIVTKHPCETEQHDKAVSATYQDITFLIDKIAICLFCNRKLDDSQKMKQKKYS